MRNRQFNLNAAEANELQGAFCNCKDGPTQTRLQAVRLYALGHSVKDIERLCVCTRSALMTWCRTYRGVGIAALFDQRKGGNSAKLKASQVEQVRALLHTYTPEQLWNAEACAGDGAFWSVLDLAHLVEERFAVVFQSATSYRSSFRKCDLTLQRPGYAYKSRSAAPSRILMCTRRSPR